MQQGNCGLHGNVRISECITGPALKLLNERPEDVRREISRQIQVDCDIGCFNLYGQLTELNPTTGEKNKREWSSMMWPELKKLLRRFDVSLAYGLSLQPCLQLTCEQKTQPSASLRGGCGLCGASCPLLSTVGAWRLGACPPTPSSSCSFAVWNCGCC